jgi:hypothetical protein
MLSIANNKTKVITILYNDEKHLIAKNKSFNYWEPKATV